MGWVEFVKEFEDEEWIVYKYSHDCVDYDGEVRIRKVQKLTDDDYIIHTSKSDWSNRVWAMKVILFVHKRYRNGEASLEKHMLAYG